jgi:hypothetical protein
MLGTMKRLLATSALACIALASPLNSYAETQITREQLRQMFSAMSDEGTWDLSKPMLWGYFFVDADTTSLKKLQDRLVKDGYRFVDIHRAGDDPEYVLHMERVEHHTVGSLYERNTFLYQLARQYGVESYDGMDVGPAP